MASDRDDPSCRGLIIVKRQLLPNEGVCITRPPRFLAVSHKDKWIYWRPCGPHARLHLVAMPDSSALLELGMETSMKPDAGMVQASSIDYDKKRLIS